MGKEIIETYTEKVLYNRLKEFKIEEKYIQTIKENIKEQIYSIIKHWNNIEYRNAILMVGLEEGKFYEPEEANLDIKSFVVVAIRNSYLECIFSVDHNLMGLDKELDDSLVKIVTKEAIEYFKDIDFSKLAKDISELEIKDIYYEAIKNYPIAWNALVQLGKCVGKKIVYPEITVKEKKTTEELNKLYEKLDVTEDKQLYEVQSGISEELSKDLIILLTNLIQEESIFYVDCFKMITRNFKKLLMIMEILLENKDYILTSNYLVGNAYIGKRTEILRPIHATNRVNAERQVADKMKREDFFCGISKLHRTILKTYVDDYIKK